MLVTRHAEAQAVLSGPRYVPPPVAQDGAEGTLARLRARVSRFRTGATHAERRRALVALLDGIDPAGLRARARALTGQRNGDWRGVQAHTATETLIEHALRRLSPGHDVDALLRETLRHDPPLTVTRRIATETGDEVTIDLVAAKRDPGVFPAPERFDPHRAHSPHLTFGHGVRPCPGPAHALALAAGVLEGLLP